MTIEIKVPQLPESVSDATIAAWHKAPGEPVMRDENLVDIETDKVVLEVVAPDDGVMGDVIKTQGATVTSDEVIGKFSAGEQAVSKPDPAKSAQNAAPAASSQQATSESEVQSATQKTAATNEQIASPSVRKFAKSNAVDLSTLTGTGKNGRITKEDVQAAIGKASSVEALKTPESSVDTNSERLEKRVPMTRLRKKIAERLVQAQHTAAILTTFNEVNMQPVMDLRAKYKETFEKKHGVKIGFMSFFTKAVVEALKRFPAVNASIDDNDIVYHGYFDIGIAVSSPRGLVVPVIRHADTLSMAETEIAINQFGQKARDGKLTIEEMTGGTFTISNGGVFGSLLSTPILNPPQSAILGMHKIEQRAVVEDGQIVIRPMMYVALSYDHRIIDGSESVRFLVTVKEMLEDPARLLLGV